MLLLGFDDLDYESEVPAKIEFRFLKFLFGQTGKDILQRTIDLRGLKHPSTYSDPPSFKGGKRCPIRQVPLPLYLIPR